MNLHIFTPGKKSVFKNIRSLVLEDSDGQRGIYPKHAPMIIELVTGVLRVTDESGNRRFLAIGGGTAEVTPALVTILSDSAEEAQDINVMRAREAESRVKARLKEKEVETDYARAQVALLRSLARLRAVGEDRWRK